MNYFLYNLIPSFPLFYMTPVILSLTCFLERKYFSECNTNVNEKFTNGYFKVYVHADCTRMFRKVVFFSNLSLRKAEC